MIAQEKLAPLRNGPAVMELVNLQILQQVFDSGTAWWILDSSVDLSAWRSSIGKPLLITMSSIGYPRTPQSITFRDEAKRQSVLRPRSILPNTIINHDKSDKNGDVACPGETEGKERLGEFDNKTGGRPPALAPLSGDPHFTPTQPPHAYSCLPMDHPSPGRSGPAGYMAMSHRPTQRNRHVKFATSANFCAMESPPLGQIGSEI
jgi:hypothetical protein